jgi:hypothetical protein
MKINKRILNLSAWLALITIILTPGKVATEGALRTDYGYPFRFFTQFHNGADGDIWFIRGVSIELLYYFFNVLIIYGLVHVLIYLKDKVKSTK